MQNRHSVIFISAIFAVFLLGTTTIFLSTTKNTPEQRVVPESTEKLTNIYQNDKYQFRISYPKELSVLETDDDGDITLKGSVDEPGDFGIHITPTTAKSTSAWLAQQPKGNTQKSGIELISWINDEPNRFALLARYLPVDSDDGRPIYGKIIQAVIVDKGHLYTAGTAGYSTSESTEPISDYFIKILESFELIK